MDKQQEVERGPPTYTEATMDPQDGKPMGYPPPGQTAPMYPATGQLMYAPPGQPAYPVYQQGYPVQYGQNVQIIQQQPMLGTQPTHSPPDHMCAAIFVTLCCFWPTGIIAIMKANDARCAMARGDTGSAHLAAKSSKQMINISIIVGIIAIIIAGLIIGLYIGLVFSHFSFH